MTTPNWTNNSNVKTTGDTIHTSSQITQVLGEFAAGDSTAANRLMTMVYDELRKLAASRLAQEKPGQTLQATALVNEAYLKLVGGDPAVRWDSRAHFFSAAAEAMRRLLVDNAHRKNTLKRGGNRLRIELSKVDVAHEPPGTDLIALDEALNELSTVEPQTAELVKLRYFAGFTNQQAAELLGISRRTADARWAYARVWLFERITCEEYPER